MAFTKQQRENLALQHGDKRHDRAAILHNPQRNPGETQEEYKIRRKQSQHISHRQMKGF